MFIRQYLLFLIVTAFFSTELTGQTDPIYEFIPLETGEFSSRANTINETGLIGGSRTTQIVPSGLNPAESYLWLDGEIIWSGHLGGQSSGVAGVNNSGTAVGQAKTAASPFNGLNCGFRLDTIDYEMEPMQELSVFNYNSANYVYGLNDKGFVVGNSRIFDEELNDGEDPQNAYHGVIWSPDGTVTDLGTLGAGYSRAFAINKDNEITGASVPTNGDIIHAVRWRMVGDSMQIQDIHDIPNCDFTDALDINDSGIILGEAFINSTDNRVVVWDSLNNSTILPLADGANCFASSINNNGDIVGQCEIFTSTGRVRKAYLYQDEQFYFLEDIVDDADADRTFEFAYDINDQGWIVGSSTLTTGFESKKESFYIRPLGSTSSISKRAELKVSDLVLSPNPGHGQPVALTFTTADADQLSCQIIDANGRPVQTIATQQQTSAGVHRFDWQPGTHLSSGTYYFVLRGRQGSLSIAYLLQR